MNFTCSTCPPLGAGLPTPPKHRRRSPAGLGDLRSVEWLGQETGHSGNFTWGRFSTCQKFNGFPWQVENLPHGLGFVDWLRASLQRNFIHVH